MGVVEQQTGGSVELRLRQGAGSTRWPLTWTLCTRGATTLRAVTYSRLTGRQTVRGLGVQDVTQVAPTPVCSTLRERDLALRVERC
jgi:hypothetical protein